MIIFILIFTEKYDRDTKDIDEESLSILIHEYRRKFLAMLTICLNGPS